MRGSWLELTLAFVIICFTTCASAQRQNQSAVCGDHIEIRTRYIKELITSTHNCASLISSLPVVYTKVLLDECERLLNVTVNHVEHLRVSPCIVDPHNSSVMSYQAYLCCPVKQNSIDQTCYACDSKSFVNIDPFDSTILGTDACNHDIMPHHQKCADDEVCFTLVTPGYKITKGCMSQAECDAWMAHEHNCQSWVNNEPFCYECCATQLCNENPSNIPNLRPMTTTGPPVTPFTGQPGSGCAGSPCANGGTCFKSNGGGFTCNCKDGFRGDTCEDKYCDSKPCGNKGKCRNTKNAPFYECCCFPPYRGENCETDLPTCDKEICNNHGRCIDYSGVTSKTDDFRCYCLNMFTGDHCEKSLPLSCGDPEHGNRRVIQTSNIKSTDKRCAKIETELRPAWETQTQTCVKHMKNEYGVHSYRNGVDGENYVSHNAYLSRCDEYEQEDGRVCTFYKQQICCMACASSPCQNGGYCIQNDEEIVCACPFGIAGSFCEIELDACYLLGDVHVLTFDGTSLHVQGNCSYTLVNHTEVHVNGSIPAFYITAKLEHRHGNSEVSYVEWIDIEIYGYIYRLDKFKKVYMMSWPGSTSADLPVEIISLPYSDPEGLGRFRILLSGNNVRFETPFGLALEYDGLYVQSIVLPTELSGDVTGLCGNFNDVDDEKILPNGTDYTLDLQSDSRIGQYYEINDSTLDTCSTPIIANIPDCDQTTKDLVAENEYCGTLSDPNGPFAGCILALTPDFVHQVYYVSCEFDICALYNDTVVMKELACSLLQNFYKACREFDSQVSTEWREDADCPYICDEDEEYQPSGSVCRPTCSDPLADATCNQADGEVCVCKDNKVLDDNGVCVDAISCGCVMDGISHQIGEVWYNSNCTANYTCQVNEDHALRTIPKVLSVPLDGCPLTCGPNGCGHLADDDPNPCVPQPCQNGGACNRNLVTYTCNCLAGYTGENCETAHSCDDDEVYQASETTCRPTCSDPLADTTCVIPDGEDCACRDNKVLHDNGTCVDALECGCVEHEVSYEIDDVWYNSNCSLFYTCQVKNHTLRAVPDVISLPYPGCAAGQTCEDDGCSGVDNDNCESNPCQAGSQCSVVGDGYVCYCEQGYTGTDCETAHGCDDDEVYLSSGPTCRPTCSDPLADATCNQADGEVCACKDNKVLDDNDVCVDAISCGCGVVDGIQRNVADPPWIIYCLLKMCQADYNGVRAVPIVNSFPFPWCIFLGDDPCQPNNPCKNGGICIGESANDFSCSCGDGYTGKDCETQTHPGCDDDEEYVSSGSTCRPTCSDPLADATCNQTDGEVCVCKDNKVLDDNGVCVDAISCGCVVDGALYIVDDTSHGWYNNDCTTYFHCESSNQSVRTVPEVVSFPFPQGCLSGSRCTLEGCLTYDDPCQPINPCKNGGICIYGTDDFSCRCGDGYTGKNCETQTHVSDDPTNSCDSNPCANGGSCEEEGGNYNCTCVDGYFGEDCKTVNGSCSAGPCRGRGSTCTDEPPNGFRCNCAHGLTGPICESADEETICYQCSKFSTQGQGFMAHPDDTMCCHYYECWKVQGTTTIESIRRTCAPGTWFDPINGPNGVPCIASKPYDDCVDTCGSCIKTQFYDGQCHLYPSPQTNKEFGYISDFGEWMYYGRCSGNAVFDNNACTCVGGYEECSCMLNLDFSKKYEDNSCHKPYVQHIKKNGGKADIKIKKNAPAPFDYAAEFLGSNPQHHFNVPMFSGMYGCHTKCLSVSFFVNSAKIPNKKTVGIVGYGDCNPGPAWGFKFDNRDLVASVGSLITSHSGMIAKVWYYVSMVFKKQGNTDTLSLYVMSLDEATACAENCVCPDAVSVDEREPAECIEPRPCGLDIGYNYGQFFKGQLGRIQVYHKCNKMACEGLHCLNQG